MTCHALRGSNKLTKKIKTPEQIEKIREQARKRKQKQREKAKASAQASKVDGSDAAPASHVLIKGISATELEQLNKQTSIRDFDCTNEYLMTLVRIDGERIKHDQKAIGTCEGCNLPLPEGCKAVFKGQFDCSYIQGLPLVQLRKTGS